MADFLQRLRRKSPETRKRIALGSSAAITALVFVMWVTVLNHDVTGSNTTPESLLDEGQTQTASPLSAFSDNAGAAFQSLRAGLRGQSATTSTGTDATTSSRSVDPTAADDYWTSRRFEPGVDEGDTAATNAQASETEPFTSRNYDPSQESEWFAQ